MTTQIIRNPRDAVLRLHPSPGVRLSVAMLVEKNEIAFAGAALGIAWRGPGSPKVRVNAGDMARYGLEVFDEVTAREGVSFEDFFAGAARAAKLLDTADDPGDDDIGEHLGNSEPASTPDTT